VLRKVLLAYYGGAVTKERFLCWTSRAGQATGFFGATLGAVLILLVWGFIASRKTP